MSSFPKINIFMILGNGGHIRILYRLYFDREPGAEEFSGWVIGGHELDSLMEDCSKYGCPFTFRPDGGKATQHKPAWYLAQSN